MQFSKDVHEFDSKIPHHVIQRFNKDYKIKAFENLLNLESIKTDHTAITALKLVIDNIESTQNYDHTNKIYADDVLIEICELLEHDIYLDKDFAILLLTEQMKDMLTLGTCPMGRSTRLWQIYKALSAKDTPIHLFPEFIGNTIELKYNIILL